MGLLVLVCLASLLLGAGEVGPLRAFAVLVGSGDSEARFVLGSLRGPRTLIGLVIGMSLGVSGALLQAVTRNPLAEPGLLGVSAGAAWTMGTNEPTASSPPNWPGRSRK
jgi:iron complex transport system permease protein